MASAMMLPLATPAIGYVAFNSLRSRRTRAMALYALTFVGVSAVYGLVATAGYRGLIALTTFDPLLVMAAVAGVAAAWQQTEAKRRALNLCMRTVPLPPVGLRADAACVRFAALHAWRCLRSCWALMLLMAAAGHTGLMAFGVMLTLTVLLVLEELTEDGTGYLLPSAAVLMLTAGVAAGWSLS
jgi:predicted metal-binding membrane protein